MRSKNEEVLNRIIEIINNSYFQESETPSMKEIAYRMQIYHRTYRTRRD